MRHPDHGIKAIIVTESKEACTEFDVKIEDRVMSCKIPGVPGIKWYIGCLTHQLRPTETTATNKGVFYTYETYLEGVLIEGPLTIDRRLKINRAHLSPARDSGTEASFFLPAKLKGGGSVQPKDWLIELKIYESDESFDDPGDPFSSARAIMCRREGTLPKLKKHRNTLKERLIVHYKWEYRCLELLLNAQKAEETPLEYQEEAGKPCVKQPGVDGKLKETPHPISISMGDAKCDSSKERLELPPKYSWGPQPKSPPEWEHKGRGFIKIGLKKDIRRDRSPLGEWVSDSEGASTQSHKSVAFQRSPTRGERPMLPIRYRQMPHLPPGWDLRYTNTYKVYYVNHKEKYTTWQHPLADKPDTKKDAIHQSNQNNKTLLDRDEGTHRARNRLQQIDERRELLRTERAAAEVNVQKAMLGYITSGEWRESNLEHWFPETEASRSIIEHIHTYFVDSRDLKRAVRIRDEITEEEISLEETLDEFERFIPPTTREPMGPTHSTSSIDEYNGKITADYRRKRNSEELEECKVEDGFSGQNHMSIGDQTAMASRSHLRNIDYREDYGPEVPVTRDGKIDPDWHRDKIARIERPCSKQHSAAAVECESRKFWNGCNRYTLSNKIDQAPKVDDLFDEDAEDNYKNQLKGAVRQSLEQYDIDMTGRAAQRLAEDSDGHALKNSEYTLLGKVSREWPSEDSDLEACEMEISERVGNPTSKVSTFGDRRSFDEGRKNLMETNQILQLSVDMGRMDPVKIGASMVMTEPTSTSTDCECDDYGDYGDSDTSMSEQISPLSTVEDQEDCDIEISNALYSLPPHRRLNKVNQTNGSLPRPVLVLRGSFRSAKLQNGKTALGQGSTENRRKKVKLGVAFSNIHRAELRAEFQAVRPSTNQTNSLPVEPDLNATPEKYRTFKPKKKYSDNQSTSTSAIAEPSGIMPTVGPLMD